jgi:hypothetical protein
MVKIPEASCPTVKALRDVVKTNQDRKRRDYLGASAVGEPCSRKIWYEYHGYERPDFDTDTLWRFEDGHRTEDLIAERLRMVEGIELWTHREDGKQFGFSALNGKFKGHVDGVIKGLIQAPKTAHLWECKAVGEKGFRDFKKMKSLHGDKNTLKNWNEQYFAQAQIYMHYMNLDRHYMTVSTPGGRDLDACRTEYNPEVSDQLIDKTYKILVAIEPPKRISEKPDFYRCRWCPFNEVCHK